MRILRVTAYSYALLGSIVLSSSTEDTVCPFQNPTPILQRNSMIYDHNLYRSRIAQGLAVHTGAAKLPRGVNMYKVEWSCRLEKLASQAVQNCITKKTADSMFGQNYEFVETTDDYDLTHPYPLALEKWIASALNENFTNEEVTFEGDTDLQAFANIIRSNTTHIGCFQRRCGSFAAVACFYDSPDIRQGDLIYQRGEGCKLDSECTTYVGSKCDVQSNLCVHSEAKINKTEPSSEVLQEVVNSDPVFVVQTNGSNMICPENVGMRDDLRRTVLSLHNGRRSQLARGLVHKQSGKSLPQAANMVKMRYSCILESFALAHAASCALNDSSDSIRAEMGENMAAVDLKDALTYKKSIQKAIASWWNSLLISGTIGLKVIFKEKHIKHPSRYFSQMGWAETHEVGCGIVRCEGFYNFVCRYYPRGNQIMHALYKEGEPCSSCPMDMSCENQTGLCILQEVQQEANKNGIVPLSRLPWIILLALYCSLKQFLLLSIP